MRKSFALCGIISAGGLVTSALSAPPLALATPLPGTGTAAYRAQQSAATGDLTETELARLDAGLQLARLRTGAAGADPFIGYLPSVRGVDFVAWRERAAARAREREADLGARERARAAPSTAGTKAATLTYAEREPRGTIGRNDTLATGERIDAFGLGPGRYNRVLVKGNLAKTAPPIRNLPVGAEDNGSIPLAIDTRLNGGRVQVRGRVGDGPHGVKGDKTGDFDFYKVDVRAGETLTIDGSQSAVDLLLYIYNDSGALLKGDVAHMNGLPDNPVTFVPPHPGTYYVSLASFDAFQEDPFDSGSGTGGSATTTGTYTATIGSWHQDRDTMRVHLAAGDVLGVSLSGGGRSVTVQRPDGGLAVATTETDLSGYYPPSSPLPGGGNATVAYVIPKEGWYGVSVGTGAGAYVNEIEVYRPGGEAMPAARVQKIVLDFDGARINAGTVFGPDMQATLSPLAAFLPKWGLTKADLRPLAAQITKTATENLRSDLIAKGGNPNLKVEIVNGLTSRDPFGEKGVSRVIVGGTMKQLGIETIGIAQYIDPGNYSQEDTAVVLLDTMSDTRPGLDSTSLNAYLRPGTDRVRFIGTAIGNVVAHEVGHYIGNFHTHNRDDVASLMDSGGAGYWRMFQAGPDRIGGTRDDGDTDFAADIYSRWEPFTGTEDTVTVSAWAFAGGRR